MSAFGMLIACQKARFRRLLSANCELLTSGYGIESNATPLGTKYPVTVLIALRRIDQGYSGKFPS